MTDTIELTKSSVKQHYELYGIEILRFICAFGVLVWHYDHFFFIGGWDPNVGQVIRPSLPLYRELSLFYENGSLAVQFFWVISGFIFFWHYAVPISDLKVGFREFLLRRFSRLYPLHLLTLLIVAAGQYLYFRSHHTTFIYSWNKPVWFVTHLLFASNWLTRQPFSFNAPIWSVSIEILIYLTFFLVVRISALYVPVAACMSAVFALGYALLHGLVNPLVFACGMYFFAGGLAQQLSVRRGAFPVACVLGAGTLAALVLGKQPVNDAYLLLLATSSTIVLTKLGENVLRAPFRRLAFLGNATYSSYLLHFPLQLLIVLVVDKVGWERHMFYSPVAFLGFLTLVIGLSLIVYRGFEIPSQDWIRAVSRFPSNRARAVAAAE